MACSDFMKKAGLLLAIVLSCTQLVLGARIELSKRLTCYQDNCLRALEANSAKASVFCLDYEENFGLPTATYTSICTENPTAVASACSCFSSLQTTTTTTTTTSTLPTPTQCNAAHNYGYGYVASQFDFESVDIYFNEATSRKFGDCCTLCYTNPDCYSFMEGTTDQSPPYDPYSFFCEIGTVEGGTWPGVSKQCPLGIATITPGGPAGPPGLNGVVGVNILTGSGLGPCGAYS